MSELVSHIAVKRRYGIEGFKTFSGLLPHGKRVLKFCIKNPTNPSGQAGFVLPAGTQTQDWVACFYNEWGNDTWLQKIASTGTKPVQTPGATGVTMGGFTVPPVYPVAGTAQAWDMNNSNHIAIDTSVYSATGFYDTFHSGLAVGQPCLASWSLQFNMGIMPSSFWAATAQYGWFRPVDVTVVVTPKKVKPWAAGPTIRDNQYELGGPAQMEGIGQVPGAIVQEGTLGGAQAYTNPALTRFETRTWCVPYPLHNGTQYDPAVTSGVVELSALPWANWQRWLMFGQSDSKLSIRFDDMLHRSAVAKRTSGGMQIRKPFLQGNLTAFPQTSNFELTQAGFGAQVGSPGPTNITAFQNYINGPGFGYQKRLGKIPIFGSRGYTPQCWVPSPAEEGQALFPYPLNVPMGDFVVDTNEWAGNYIDRTSLTAYWQDFSIGTAPVPGGVNGGIAGKPILMNPPMEWDVYFYVNVEFGGKQTSLLGAALAQH